MYTNTKLYIDGDWKLSKTDEAILDDKFNELKENLIDSN